MNKQGKINTNIEYLKKNMNLQLFNEGGESGQGGDGGSKTFTQDDIDKIVKGRITETKKATEKSILEALGVEKIDDLQAIVKAKKEADESNKTELQKLQDQITNLAKEKEITANKAKQTLIIADFKVKAITQGLDAKQIEAALKLAEMSSVSVNEDGSVTGTEDVIKKVLEDYPFLKGTANTNIGGGAGGNPAGGDDGKGGKTSIGQRLAASRKQSTETASKAQNHYFK